MKSRFLIVLLILSGYILTCSDDPKDRPDPTPTPFSNTATFTRTYGSDAHELGYSIVKTSDGGYVLCGITSNLFGNPVQILVIKIDEFGNVEWSRIYGYEEESIKIIQTYDDGYLISGSRQVDEDNYECNVMLIKVSDNGETEWLKYYNVANGVSEICPAILQNADGSYVCCCSKAGPLDDDYYAFLMKIDEQGEKLWEKVIAEKGSSTGSFCRIHNNSGFIIGSQYDNGIGLIRVDNEGNVLWESKFGRMYDTCNDVHILNDNSIVLCGSRENYINPTSIILYKTNNEGDVEWETEYAALDLDCSYNPLSMKITSDSGFVLCGTSTDVISYDDTNIFIYKTDHQGKALWFHEFGGQESERGYEIQIAHDNGLIFLGYTYSFGAGNCDFYLIKTDENGEL